MYKPILVMKVSLCEEMLQSSEEEGRRKKEEGRRRKGEGEGGNVCMLGG